jgi:hypothetical protein
LINVTQNKAEKAVGHALVTCSINQIILLDVTGGDSIAFHPISASASKIVNRGTLFYKMLSCSGIECTPRVDHGNFEDTFEYR